MVCCSSYFFKQFYDADEAQKYTAKYAFYFLFFLALKIYSTRIIEIQNQLAERALELLALDPAHPSLLLDIGCGSGLSGEVLSDSGHIWVGVGILAAQIIRSYHCYL